MRQVTEVRAAVGMFGRHLINADGSADRWIAAQTATPLSLILAAPSAKLVRADEPGHEVCAAEHECPRQGAVSGRCSRALSDASPRPVLSVSRCHLRFHGQRRETTRQGSRVSSSPSQDDAEPDTTGLRPDTWARRTRLLMLVCWPLVLLGFVVTAFGAAVVPGADHPLVRIAVVTAGEGLVAVGMLVIGVAIGNRHFIGGRHR